MNLKVLFAILLAGTVITFWVFPLVASAHPGRTDSYGCHTCRTNCSSWGLSYGEYHCHRAKSLPQPEAPIKSHYGPEGSGYTEPAPEYETPYNANISAPVDLAVSIRTDVLAQKTAYYQSPHLFRERLIDQLNQRYGQNYWIGFFVYNLL